MCWPKHDDILDVTEAGGPETRGGRRHTPRFRGEPSGDRVPQYQSVTRITGLMGGLAPYSSTQGTGTVGWLWHSGCPGRLRH